MLQTNLYIWLFILAAAASAAPAAFPGALGFGANATGGRAGKVYHVTNLNDAGAGSFRDAVSAANRIVVFDVGGCVTLKTAVSAKSNLTIAGQTAPGEGIGFIGGEISFANSSNVICRSIRVRPGSETESDKDDALSLYRAKNIILDHCSFEFAPWNNIDGVGDNGAGKPVTDITFQYCLIANPTGQQFGSHCESVNGNWAWFYCIFANSHNRNPLAKVNDIFVNNVLYNYSAGYTTHTSTPFKHDIINNYFIFGPASTGTDNTWFQIDKNQSIYCSGNLKDKNLDGVLNGDPTIPYWYQGEGTILTSPWSPLPSTVTVYSPNSAYRVAVSLCGTLPRDQMDSLIINQVRLLGKGSAGLTDGTAGPGSGLYTSQTQTGLLNNGYGTIRGGTKEIDSDSDGMPDFWEKTAGTNVNLNDAMTIASDGYANIEQYINWLAGFHAMTLSTSSAVIDLSQYAAGFNGGNIVYRVDSATNGNVILDPDGHTAKFTPADRFGGLASFDFTISGSDNSSFGNKVIVAVVPSGTTATSDRCIKSDKERYLHIVNTNGQNIITIDRAFTRIHISVFDLSGKLQLQNTVEADKPDMKIDIRGLHGGAHVLRWRTDNGMHGLRCFNDYELLYR